MFRIGVCDDSLKMQEDIKGYLKDIEKLWETDFKVTVFSSGEQLCHAMKNELFDVILLDIIMDGIDGAETATRISSMGSDVPIIFISSYDKCVKDLFKFNPVAFLDKPVDVAKLKEALERAKAKCKRQNSEQFCYTDKCITYSIPIRKIIYFEIRHNKATIYTTEGEFHFYSTLALLWDKLSQRTEFIRPHKSFIFNLSHVTIRKSQVCIKGTDECFNVGRIYKNDTLQRYSIFLGEERGF